MTYSELKSINTTGIRTNHLISSLPRSTSQVAPGFLHTLSNVMDEENVEFVGKPFTKAYQNYCEVR